MTLKVLYLAQVCDRPAASSSRRSNGSKSPWCQGQGVSDLLHRESRNEDSGLQEQR